MGTPLEGTRCRLWQLPCGTVWAYTLSTGTMGAWLPSPRFLRTAGRATGSEPHPEESHCSRPQSAGAVQAENPCRDRVIAETPSAQRSGGAGLPEHWLLEPCPTEPQRQSACPSMCSRWTVLSLSLMWLALLGLDLLKTIPSFLLSYLSLLE